MTESCLQRPRLISDERERERGTRVIVTRWYVTQEGVGGGSFSFFFSLIVWIQEAYVAIFLLDWIPGVSIETTKISRTNCGISKP